MHFFFFFSSRRRHTRFSRDWSSDVCSSDLTPPTGWPICIYAHGTGGDWESFVDDGTGLRLALQGIATISTDQVLHGPRNPGGDPETAFFNFGNPYAGR